MYYHSQVQDPFAKFLSGLMWVGLVIEGLH